MSGYARYFHLIYLMAGSIAVFFGCGYLLDKLLRLSVPVFKVILSFAGVVVALYLVYRELNRKN
ncbi:MAG: AtpZ/AtpI family protein [Chitinophagales bacterium]|nr:AtpZ/AtpI family protein [Chitinophagales bacterium]MDW8426948.1 AtpZ/AtpI family protein [Chitinophagales bacterium]